MELSRLTISMPSVEPGARPAVGGASQPGFSDALGKALASVEELQQAADRESDALAHGGGNLHEAALALEKADVGMRLATKVRNRFVEAYQEIMRMNV
jgi:flagellar hook-basal body complex protein FliE